MRYVDQGASGWVSSALVGVAEDSGFRRLQARQPILAGELLLVWGGRILDGRQLSVLSPEELKRTVQVDEDHYLFSTVEGPSDWINHSCEPNGILRGQTSVVARRDIAPGEDVTYDYATTDGSPYDEFVCRCGAPSCRQLVSGRDWQNPALWTRYAGGFSPYLARRIQGLQASGADASASGADSLGQELYHALGEGHAEMLLCGE